MSKKKKYTVTGRHVLTKKDEVKQQEVDVEKFASTFQRDTSEELPSNVVFKTKDLWQAMDQVHIDQAKKFSEAALAEEDPNTRLTQYLLALDEYKLAKNREYQCGITCINVASTYYYQFKDKENTQQYLAKAEAFFTTAVEKGKNLTSMPGHQKIEQRMQELKSGLQPYNINAEKSVKMQLS